MNGRKCSFSHPVKCHKFCRYGRDNVKGCTGDCKLFHPTLCHDSLKFRQCFKTDCTLVHLYGTERSNHGLYPQPLSRQRPPLSWEQGSKYHASKQYNNHTTHSRGQSFSQGMSNPHYDYDPSNELSNSHWSRKLTPKNVTNDFPPLPSVSESQSVKINELTAAVVKQIQDSLEKLMLESKNGVSFPQHPSNSNHHQVYSQFPPQPIYEPIPPKPVYDQCFPPVFGQHAQNDVLQTGNFAKN